VWALTGALLAAPVAAEELPRSSFRRSHPDHARPSRLASDVIGDLVDRRESSPLARVSEYPAHRLAHDGTFA